MTDANPTTESGSPIEWTEDGRRFAMQFCEAGHGVRLTTPATATNLVAALVANPGLQAHILGQLTDGRKCHECGAEWMTDMQLDRMADKVDPYIERAKAAESELTTCRERLEHITEDRRIQRVRAADAEIALTECQYELTKCKAELERYRKFACDVQERLDSTSIQPRRLFTIREALAELRGVTPPETVTLATGDQEAEAAESELTKCKAELERVRDEAAQSESAFQAAHRELDETQAMLRQARLDAGRMHYLGGMVRSRTTPEQDELNALMRKYPPVTAAPATGDQEAAPVGPAPKPQPGGDYVTMEMLTRALRAPLRYEPETGWKPEPSLEALADELERGRRG